MLAEERREKIAGFIEISGYAELGLLMDRFDVSESTIRRDLSLLEKEEKIKRTYGGAIALRRPPTIPSFSKREVSHEKEKRRIGRAAARFLHDGRTIFLDGGTTTTQVALSLLGKKLRVITNGLNIASVFSKSSEIEVLMTGGILYPRTNILLGPFARELIARINTDWAVMGVEGISDEGITNSNILIAETEKGMIKKTERLMVVADSSKFGRKAMAFLAPLSAVDILVTDKNIPGSYRRLLDKAKVKLVLT